MDSNLSILLLALFLLIVAVAAVRRRVVFEIQSSSLLLFGNAKAGIYIYSLIFLPGTILHELSHWLFAEILQVRTGKLVVLPDLESKSSGGEERLGYVMTGSAGVVRSFLIGFAPLVTGLGALVYLGYLLNNVWKDGVAWWVIALILYGLIVVSNSMIVSKADMKNWPIIIILAVLIGVLLYSANLSLPELFLDSASQVLLVINKALGLTIGLNLAMICGLYLARRSIEKIMKKKIVIGRQ